jgi:polar amino acid transport system substrate-binding protein
MDSSRKLFVLFAAPAILACNFPHDADGTLSRINNGVMRVGVSGNEPWTAFSGDSISGYEASIVGDLARQMHASIEVHSGAESTVLQQLHERKLDLVIGGLSNDSPWKQKIALTRPYHTDKDGKQHVLALPPGENSWLVRVEEYLHENELRLKAIPE